MLAVCDGEKGCGEEFDLEKLEVDKLDGGIEKTYFVCPQCDKEYLCFYTDVNIRRKQGRIRTFTNINKINKLKKEIGKDMNDLKAKVLGTQ